MTPKRSGLFGNIPKVVDASAYLNHKVELLEKSQKTTTTVPPNLDELDISKIFNPKTNESKTDTVKVVFVRHGESTWNKCGKFTGWIDVPLSEQGR